MDDAHVEAVIEMLPVFVGLALTAHDEASVPITLPQFRALVALDRFGPCSAGGLASRLGLHTSSVTRVSDRLVKSGELTRETNPDNRREVTLRITPKGRRHVAKVLEVRAREVRRVLEALPLPVRQSLAEVAAAVVAADRSQRGRLPDSWVG